MHSQLSNSTSDNIENNEENAVPVDVVGIGTVCVDLNATVTSIPKVDENVLALDHRKHLGGPVATALATLQRLGMSTTYMGMLGNDEYGQTILAGLQAEEIDTSALRIVDGENSPFSFVLVDSTTGGRSIAHYPGCRFHVPADCVDHDNVRNARLLHVDMAAPAVLAACETANKAGVPVSVDANLLFPRLEELLMSADIFIPARRLARELSGEPDPVKAAEKLIAKYNLDLAVITCGDEGSVAVTQNEIARSAAFEVKVVDTTGAGDVFHGAYLYGYLNGWSLERALRFANGTAALMCTNQDGWAGIPKLSEVKSFLGENEQAP